MPEQFAAARVKVLRRAVPDAVPGICFLLGGRRPERDGQSECDERQVS
jgi:fructose-bisphosphate aldolase class 1